MALVQHTEINELEFSNCFPLHFSCKNGDSQAAKVLLQSNVNLAFAEDRFYGWTPAHWAAYFGKLDCLKTVMSVLPNGVNMQTSKLSQTPAHSAAEAGQPHCLLWLLHAGADPNMKDFLGETPLHKCSRSGSAECVGLLTASSADVRVTNNAGELAGIIAEKNGHHTIAEYIHRAELFRVLGGNVHHAHSNGLQSGFIPRSNTFLHMKRKRDFDFNNNDVPKKMCFGGLSSETVLSPPVTSSVMEYHKLCNMEHSYANYMIDAIIAEFHGC